MPGPGVLAQVGRHQAAVVAGRRQLDVAGALGAGRRVGPGAATAVDLDGQVDVLAGAEAGNARLGSSVSVTLRGVCRAHRDDLRAGLARVQVGVDQLGVAVHAVRPGEQIDQRERSTVQAGQSFSEHVYTVRTVLGRFVNRFEQVVVGFTQ